MGKITVAADQEFRVLGPMDKCDACNAQAFVLVIFPEDKALTFCGHHWNQHSARLIELAVDIVDETGKIE